MRLEVERMLKKGAFVRVKRGGVSDGKPWYFGLKSKRSIPSNLTDDPSAKVSKGSRPNSQIPGEADLGVLEHISRLFRYERRVAPFA